MNKKYIFVLMTILMFFILKINMVSAQEFPIDITLASQYFNEATVIADKDNGKLWGVSLKVPIFFVDPKTRMIVANQKDNENKLKQKGEVFIGYLPDDIGLANTVITWSGVKWAMMIWPLHENNDKYERDALIIHESWHCIQDRIGLSIPSILGFNQHLDTMNGRVWLQLEWRALSMALESGGAERLEAIKDALVFWAYRRELFPNAAKEESVFEIIEGLAEYTGVKLCGVADSDLPCYEAKRISKQLEEISSFTRSFPYISGPAYGILLDQSNINWRKDINSKSDLGGLLQKAFCIKIPNQIKEEAFKRSVNYEADKLISSKMNREKENKKRLAEYKKRFIDGPTLCIPLSHKGIKYLKSVVFDPRGMYSIDENKIVFNKTTIIGKFGTLDAFNGAMMKSDWSKVYVPAPIDVQARPLCGDGWTLKINPGWEIKPAERKGDYILEKNN